MPWRNRVDVEARRDSPEMMALRAAIAATGLSRTRFAARVGIKRRFLAQILAGKRPVPAAWAPLIEDALARACVHPAYPDDGAGGGK
jgi:DNA-binding transcriptional regulator YdaS (Cro superfamily)